MPITRYVNLRTDNLIEVFNEGPATFTIATVTDGGYGRRRPVPAASFHKNYLASDGQPHAQGYVPVNALPGDHPRAMKTEMTRMELLNHLDQLSSAELADLVLKQQQAKADAETLIDRAKAVLKSRRSDEGLEMHGNVSAVFTSGKKFNAKLATANLTPEQLQAISVRKPDATLAKDFLDADTYAKCQADNGFTLTIREATDKDRLAVLASQRSQDTESLEAAEGFKIEDFGDLVL